MTRSTSPSDRPGSPVTRLRGAALTLVAALACAFVLVAVLAVAAFMGWPRGDAPDLYSQANASERAVSEVWTAL